MLWIIGAFGDPATEGAMCLFSSRPRAEEFVAADPLVRESVVEASAIREWDPLVYEPS